MQQHDTFRDELLDVCHLFLPESIVDALRSKAAEQTRLLRDLMNDQATRLLCEPSFLDDAVGLADAFWKRLADRPSGSFAWPADPLVCVGGTLVFVADLKRQVQQDLLTVDDDLVNRFRRQAARRGMAYDQLVNETAGLFWRTGLLGPGPTVVWKLDVSHRTTSSQRPAGDLHLSSREDLTPSRKASEPDLVDGLGR